MKKVLIIEDEPTIAELYTIVFSKRQYAVELAYDGEEGIVKAKQVLPDIVLVDIMMPKMNGLQVTQHLKADPQTNHIPIYALSNLTDPATEQAILQAGALQFVVKSDHLPDQIVDMVDAYFQQGKATSVSVAHD